jgi:hypothetical protein
MAGLILGLAAATASAQPGGGGGPGGGGFGGRGGFGGGMGGMMGSMGAALQRASSWMIVNSPDVQKELSVTDDQKTKLGDVARQIGEDARSIDFAAFFDMDKDERNKFVADQVKKTDEKLAKVLDEKQMERLKQLEVQQQGIQALIDPDIVAKLKLSKEAQDKIKTVLDDSRKQQQQTNQNFDWRNASDDERKEFRDKQVKQRADTLKSALAALDDDQLVEWGKLTGKEFTGQLNAFGGFGGGFGGRGGRGGGGGPGGPGGGGPGGGGGGGGNPPPGN